MADIRIKDLVTTASSAASDDFLAVDGFTKGTRKMSAANPSVTTLTTSGVIAPGGSVHGANGSAANPSFAFLSNQNTGLYRIGLDNIGVAANGAKVLDIATTGLTVTGALGASSLTSPAATDLTLAGGSSGASLVLGQGANASTAFVGTGTGLLSYTKTTGNPTIRAIAPAGGSGVFEAYTPSTSALSVYGLFSVIEGNGNKWENGFYGTLDYVHRYNSSEKLRFTTTGNVLIGTTVATGLTGAGGLKINSSTAGSASAGALVVTGGLATGAASYFGGAVTVTGAISATGSVTPLSLTPTGNAVSLSVVQGNDANAVRLSAGGNVSAYLEARGFLGVKMLADTSTIGTFSSTGLAVTGTLSTTGAATFAGAVTVANANGIDINSGGTTAIFSQSVSSVRKNFIYFDGTNTTLGTDTGAIILSPSSVVQIASGKALKLGNAYVGTPVVSSGYITIQDNTGTTYKVAVSL